MVFGNGIANIIAAVIIALALVWTSGGRGQAQSAERDYAEWYARAVGDIRNDIVVNCGCCGEDAGQKRAGVEPF